MQYSRRDFVDVAHWSGPTGWVDVCGPTCLCQHHLFFPPLSLWWALLGIAPPNLATVGREGKGSTPQEDTGNGSATREDGERGFERWCGPRSGDAESSRQSDSMTQGGATAMQPQCVMVARLYLLSRPCCRLPRCLPLCHLHLRH